ncbi:AAA family ATPase [Bremerella sp. JC817]|uniref:AAA family ATPase n=1 Tax=Bremerella sp. JC817 TaxID=3231756 RepID=UPI0034580E98
MQLNQIQIDGFGVWHDLSVEQLSPTITVLFGHNEAGKSTLLHFLRTMLYGQEPDLERRYLPPIHGGEPGGGLRVNGAMGRFKVVRRFNHDGSEEQVWIEASDGSRQSRAQLDALLEGVDRLTYSNIFAVGLREMQLLATLDDSVAAQKIYELTSGLDRISLAEVMRELEASRCRLISGRDEEALVDKLLEKHQILKKEIEQLRGGTQEWSNLINQRRALQTQIDQFQFKVADLERLAQFIELGQSLRPEIQRRNKLQEKIAAYGELPEVSRDTLRHLHSLQDQISKKRTKCRELRAQYTELRERHSSIPVNQELARQAARVDALGEQRQWILSLTQQLERNKEEETQIRSEIEDLWEQTGVKTRAGKNPDLSRKQLRSLREPLRTLERSTEELESARKHTSTHDEELLGVESEVEESLTSLGEEDLNKALAKAGDLVNLLRRRIQVEDKIDQIRLQYRESEGETHDLLEDQITPKPEMVMLGAMFIVGSSMTLYSMFGPALLIGWQLGHFGWIFGTMAMVASYSMKRKLDNESAQRFDSAKRQLMLLDQQMDKAITEQKELDIALPRGNGALMARLKSAEDHLTRLEELIPLGHKLGEVREKQETSTRQISELESAVVQAKKRWKETLRVLDLPEDINPDRVKSLGRFLAQIHQYRKRLKAIQGENEIALRERDALLTRISHLAKDVGVAPKTQDALLLLDQLEDDLLRQEGKHKQRTGLFEQGQKVRGDFRRVAEEAKALMAEREQLLEEASSSDEEEYLTWIVKTEEVEELEAKLEALTETIDEKIGTESTLEEIEAWLETTVSKEADEQLAKLLADHQHSEKRMQECFERRGELKVQLESLEKNDRLLHAQLELSEVEAQLEKAIEKWQTLATTSCILEQIRRVYESDRQPETLRLASSYMRKLTDDRYIRIWTPLHENTLFVEERYADSKSLAHLSEGTREQVFLSVRLALIHLFARQGRVLPVILDDVLVNFDSKRSKATANLFREFASEGHQLLIFTCHEHIAAMFQDMGADVRQLPKFTGLCRPGLIDIDQPMPKMELEAPKPEPEPEPASEPKPAPKKVKSTPLPKGEITVHIENPKPEPVPFQAARFTEVILPPYVPIHFEVIKKPVFEDIALPIVEVPNDLVRLRVDVLQEEVSYRLKGSDVTDQHRLSLADFDVDMSAPANYRLKDADGDRKVAIDWDALLAEEPVEEEPYEEEVEFPVADAILEPEVELDWEPDPEPEPEPEPVLELVPEPKPEPVLIPAPKKKKMRIRYVYTQQEEFGWDSPRRWYEEKDPRKDHDEIEVRQEIVDDED